MKELFKHSGRYSIIRSTYLQMCGGDLCAAQLLAALEDWTVCKLNGKGSVKTTWLDIHVDSLVDSVCGTFGRDRVLASFDSLKKQGFVEEHPSTGWTFICRLNISKIQEALDDLYGERGGAA